MIDFGKLEKEAWKKAKSKDKLFKDYDKDGVLNAFDCKPHNKNRQDFFGDVIFKRQTVKAPAGELEVYDPRAEAVERGARYAGGRLASLGRGLRQGAVGIGEQSGLILTPREAQLIERSQSIREKARLREVKRLARQQAKKDIQRKWTNPAFDFGREDIKNKI